MYGVGANKKKYIYKTLPGKKKKKIKRMKAERGTRTRNLVIGVNSRPKQETENGIVKVTRSDQLS